MLSLDIDPRVLGQRIAEARKARGKTQEEVAEFLGYSRPTYIAIEKGERPAKPDEIIKLASFFGRKVNELVRPGEPVTDLQPHLRAVADKMKPADRTGLNAAIDQLQALAEDYRELERIMNAPLRPSYPPEVMLNPRIDPAEQAEVVAEQERKRLGLGDQPVIDLRNTLEWDVGLRIFYTGDLPSNIAGMYAYSAELGACILINRKHPPERRRVSMLHEYGHFLLSTDRYKPGIDYLTIPGRKPANERFAEAFALSFLMPATSVRQQFQQTRGDDRRLPGGRPLPHEALLLRLAGGDDVAGRAAGPDPEGNVGAPEGVAIRPTQGGRDARTCPRTPSTTAPSPSGTGISPSMPTSGANSATATSPITCGATSSRPARSWPGP